MMKRERINHGLGYGKYCPYCGAKMDEGARMIEAIKTVYPSSED